MNTYQFNLYSSSPSGSTTIGPPLFIKLDDIVAVGCGSWDNRLQDWHAILYLRGGGNVLQVAEMYTTVCQLHREGQSCPESSQ